MDLAEVIASQDGIVTRQQALDAGMTPGAIRHRLTGAGRWQRLAPGLYATFTGRLSPRQRLRATLLHAGPDAVLSGSDAARAHGLRYVPAQRQPLVLVPPEVRTASTSFVVVRRTLRLPEPRIVRGLPVAPVERAVMDASRLDVALHPSGISLQDVRALVCESVQRRLTTPQRLADELEATQRNGTGHLRRAVADVTAGCWSAPECEFRDLVMTSTVLPEPQWNTPLPGLDHIVPDGWWIWARLVAEIDSAEYHQLGLGPERTQARHSEMIAAGWTVMSIAPRRIRRAPQEVLRDLESAYEHGITG